MDLLGWTHFLLAITAIVSGGVVALRAKGTYSHRIWGWVYLLAMVMMNLTALMIYDLFGHFGPFHWAALASLATVLAGWLPARRSTRRHGWLPAHATFMSWSYVGLLAAAVAESSTRWLNLPFGWTVAVSSLIVIVVGGMVISRRVPVAYGRLNR